MGLLQTHGLVDLFNRADFERVAVASVNEPFIAKPKLLALMYLTFAIGLILATPGQESKEAEIIGRLRQAGFDVAENFFRNTKRLVDPLTIQENADFWSVQILHLMSIYMLSISRRNAAYAYLGNVPSAPLSISYKLAIRSPTRTSIRTDLLFSHQAWQFNRRLP